jgi:hypothetical protein
VRRYSPFVSAEAMHRLDYLNAAKEAFKRASQLMLSYQYQVLCAPGLAHRAGRAFFGQPKPRPCGLAFLCRCG